MTNKVMAGAAVGVVVTVTALTDVFMTPYNRIAGVHTGGVETPVPSDWRTVNDASIIQLKVFFWTPR